MAKVLTFHLCGSLFGLDITLVKEINRNVEYTPIPGAKPYIIGLFNMRGQVVTLFDLGILMGYGNESRQDSSSCIILKAFRNDSDQIGFLIEKKGDVADIDEELFEPPPSNVGGIDSEFISGVVKLKDELLIILNADRIFEGS
ncbi:MAG: chemotaxis protein CheW [Clostridia bacterium]|nr:chemotaxis protein CheW [Clostridia bacterium]